MMSEIYYERWEKLRKAERRAWALGKRSGKWKAFVNAARRLADHELAFGRAAISKAGGDK